MTLQDGVISKPEPLRHNNGLFKIFFSRTFAGVIGRYPLQLMGLLKWLVSLLRVRFDQLVVYSSYNWFFYIEEIKECL